MNRVDGCRAGWKLLPNIKSIQGDPYSFYHKSRKGAIGTFDSFFHLAYNIIWESNSLYCGIWDFRNMKSSHIYHLY